MNKNIISIKNLHKEYFANNIKQVVLNKIDFKMFEGDIVSISGPSGSGKSTFLNILGFLDSDFKGDYFFLDDNTKNIIMGSHMIYLMTKVLLKGHRKNIALFRKRYPSSIL